MLGVMWYFKVGILEWWLVGWPVARHPFSKVQCGSARRGKVNSDLIVWK